MAVSLAIDLVALTCGLLAWGAHAVLPWQLVRADPAARRRWALAALPLAVLGGMTTALRLSARPDVALNSGWSEAGAGAFWRAVLVLFLAMAAADGVLLWSRGRLERSGWIVLAGLATPSLIAWAASSEQFHLTRAPLVSVGALAGVLCVALMALGAGEALAPGRPWWAPAAGGAIAAYVMLLESAVSSGIVASRDIFTAGAALVLFVAAPWLPPSLRRPGLLAATLLCALFLARVAALSRLLAIT